MRVPVGGFLGISVGALQGARRTPTRRALWSFSLINYPYAIFGSDIIRGMQKELLKYNPKGGNWV